MSKGEEERRLWGLVNEYRTRTRNYAWLLVVGVPAAFFAWHKTEVPEISSTSAALLAMLAQGVLLYMSLMAINFHIEYRCQAKARREDVGETVKVRVRKKAAICFKRVGFLGFVLIALGEFIYFFSRVDLSFLFRLGLPWLSVAFSILACVGWPLLWLQMLIRVEGGRRRFRKWLNEP